MATYIKVKFIRDFTTTLGLEYKTEQEHILQMKRAKRYAENGIVEIAI